MVRIHIDLDRLESFTGLGVVEVVLVLAEDEAAVTSVVEIDQHPFERLPMDNRRILAKARQDLEGTGDVTSGDLADVE